MKPETFAECIADATDRLKSAGIENPRRESRLLLAHAMGVDAAVVIGFPERIATRRDEFLGLIERRASGAPMAQILGKREFWSLDFQVTADTLDPRPDSEILVEAVLSAVGARRNEALRILDLGTGTGCLLLSLLSEMPCAEGLAVDLSAAAIAVARANADRLALADRARFMVGDWTTALDGRFDVVLSNPPYIPSGAIDKLQPEVAMFEPRLALDGGIDGLNAYRRLAAEFPRLMADDGVAAFEVGMGQWRDASSAIAARRLTKKKGWNRGMNRLVSALGLVEKI
jgi:release factor glutamine methyltransferase